MIPVLVGFNPTFFIIIFEFGIISAAVIKYAADDMSPKISIFIGLSSDFSIVVVLLSVTMDAPMCFNNISV